MKFLTIALFLVSISAHAMEKFPASGNTLSVYTEAEYQAIDNGSIPACVKDGGKYLGFNKAYRKQFGTNKSQCSASKGAKRVSKDLYGYEVIVVKKSELPTSELKKI